MSSASNPESTPAQPPVPSVESEVKPTFTLEDISRLLDSKIATQTATLNLTTCEVKSDLARFRGDVIDRLDGHDQAIADLGRRLTALETTPPGTTGAFMPPPTVATAPPAPSAVRPPFATPYLGQATPALPSTVPSTVAPTVGRVGLGLTSQPWPRSEGRTGVFASDDARLEVRGESQLPSASEDSTANEKVLYCKAERLGEFHGDPLELEFWIGTVRDVARTNPSRAWQAAVRAAIPSALKGDAREWHVALNDDEVRSMPDLPSYFKAMRANFPVDYVTLRKNAYARQWDPTKETALGYSQVKIRLLRQATPEGTPEEMIVNDVMDGLLPSLQQIIRLPRGKERTVTALKLELGEQEPIWRRIYKVERQSGGVSMVATDASSAYTHPTSTSPSAFPTDQRRAFRYDPARVIEAKGDLPRQYRKENGRVLRLNRPCGKCGQPHFDFEHDTLVGKVYSLVETSDYEEVEETQSSGF
ncbi:hypothetical protein CF326_g6820 [Tilletia indica]|nr:hypothetical protein CF326_g6820 [Tilletia indica]